MADIAERTRSILHRVPDHVTVVGVAKGQPIEVVMAAVEAGLRVVGQNYISDARRVRPALASRASLHFIGRLRSHDVRPATLELFDMVQSVDSLVLARRIDLTAAGLGHPMPVLVEVNSGREPQKGGVEPEHVEELMRDLSLFRHVRVAGLMTMGPLLPEPSQYRKYFAETRRLLEYLRGQDIPGLQLTQLSMGTSDSWEVAIEEGATMVRIGTALFGPR